MTRRCVLRALAATLVYPVIVVAAGCHSYHIDTTIQNRTGAAIQLLEVDYPNASFGANALASGADFHYRIQVQGSGQLKITYTDPANKQTQIDGPALAQHQQGRLEIILLPGGKADFRPQLTGP